MTLRVQEASTDNSCGGSGAGTAMVRWGDGSTTSQSISTGVMVGSHTYSQRGIYTISYSIRDAEGNRSMVNPVTVTVPDTGSSVFAVYGTICVDGNADNLCGDPSDEIE